MTHLRQTMLDELQRRNYAKTTVESYIHAVEQFAKHFKRRPDQLNQDHLRTYQAYLLRERKLGPRTVRLHVAAHDADDAVFHEHAQRGAAPPAGPRHRQPAHADSHSTWERRPGSVRPAERDAARDAARVLALDETHGLVVSGHDRRLAGGHADHTQSRLGGLSGCGRTGAATEAGLPASAAPFVCDPPPGSGCRLAHDSAAPRPRQAGAHRDLPAPVAAAPAGGRESARCDGGLSSGHGAPGRSSSGTNPRPAFGDTPNTSTKFADTVSPRISIAPSAVSRTAPVGSCVPIARSAVDRARRASRMAPGTRIPVRRSSRPQISTSRCASLNGSGRNNTASTRLNSAVVLPIPTASVTMASAVNHGDRVSVRAADRMSATTLGMARSCGTVSVRPDRLGNVIRDRFFVLY